MELVYMDGKKEPYTEQYCGRVHGIETSHNNQDDPQTSSKV